MTRLNAHDTHEALEYLRQEILAAEMATYRFAHSRGYAARMAGKPRKAMYASIGGATEADDAAWLDGWDAADEQDSQS